MIAGFVVEEANDKPVLIRGVGPALTDYGVDGALADPTLMIYNADEVLVASNQGWENDAAAAEMPELFARLGAFPWPKARPTPRRW